MRALAAFSAAVLLWGSAGSTTLRFHHIHYKVADPSVTMAEVLGRIHGRREIVQGLGVGVRIGDAYLLFDREDGTVAAPVQRPLAEAYAAAQAWLNAQLLVVDKMDVPPLGAPDQPIDHIAFATDGEVDFLSVTEALAKRSRVVQRRDGAVLFETSAGLRVEIVRDTGRPDAFWCPMHPDVRSPSAATCPLCAMDLVPIPPPTVGEYKMDVVVDRTKGGVRGFRFTVREPDTQAVVRNFATVHEKPFHLFIVSRDLEYFAHVHPEQTADGSFVLPHTLPRGEYMLIADFLPQGGTSQMVQRAVIAGEPPSASEGPPRTGASPASVVVDGLRVSLQVEDFAPGKHACLTFTLADAKTGEAVTDLQPYLGAPAHMLLVRADLTDVVHAHPEEVSTPGPTVSFHPLVPAAGAYKLWVQVQRGGRVITVPFLVSAPS